MAGATADADAASVSAMLRLNAEAVVENTIRFLPGMVSRGRGVVVNVSSTGTFQPVPHMAAYAASKALVQSFTLGTAAEVAAAGVRMLALCPGVTATGMYSKGLVPAVGGLRTPEQVVTTAFRALAKRKASVVDGRRNALFARAGRHLPERASLARAGRLMRAGSAGT
ncbi:hypothetical protein GCM10022222_81410 [Amycolatopsis ultiminotia]|uniref:Short chain dehydrogenase n=1 Tax=Amycolatopsis ultiminotia TaxID=543629 RepID=A0ABP6YIX8_9PSEU